MIELDNCIDIHLKEQLEKLALDEKIEKVTAFMTAAGIKSMDVTITYPYFYFFKQYRYYELFVSGNGELYVGKKYSGASTTKAAHWPHVIEFLLKEIR